MVQIVNPLENAIGLLQDFGFFSVVLPFLLIYSLVYGLLINTKMFGDDSGAKSVCQVIALAVGAFVITSTDVVNLMLGVIPQASFLLVVVLMLMMIASLMGLTGSAGGLFGDGGFKTFKGFSFLVITLIFLMIIDAGVEGGIPIIHQLNELVIGSQPFVLQGEALSTLLGLAFVIGIPIAVVVWLSKASGGSSSP